MHRSTPHPARDSEKMNAPLVVAKGRELVAANIRKLADAAGFRYNYDPESDEFAHAAAIMVATPEGKLAPIEAEADGTITGVEVEDLNDDGYPEIYVYVTSAGSGSYGSLIEYASNCNRSLSDIYLPPLEDDPEASKGYMGHDTFVVGEGTFVRRFPVYREGDTNAAPTSGNRQIQYKLAAGEAGWVLRKDRIVEGIRE